MTPPGRSRLVFGAGVLGRLGTEAARFFRPGPCLLVTDRTVARLYGGAAERALRAAGFRPRRLVLPPGEGSKDLAGLARVLGALARMGADRGTPVVALGGGVVTDLAGFGAAVYARGVPWVAVPTTLLGMVDAAVGGKTGIDLPEGKNLAGAFHAPRLVLADAEVLRTLPRRHLRNGLAEVAKAALLDGLVPGLARLGRLEGLEGDPRGLAAAAASAARRKASIVARDPLDLSGERALLNLGHTAGHALEAAAGFSRRLLHGEAVAVGLVVAARLAERRGLLAGGEAEALAAALRRLHLPVRPPRGFPVRRALGFLGVDKKRIGGRLCVVLPRSRARALVVAVTQEEMANALGVRPLAHSASRSR